MDKELPIERMLSDLLAIIHRDGGHRQDEVGTEQAWMEAMMTVPFLLDGKDRIHALEAELTHSNELIAEILDGSKIEKAALEAVLAGVCARLDILQMREAAYRSAHDLHGDGSMKSGAAWDAMRHAGDAARAILHRREVG